MCVAFMDQEIFNFPLVYVRTTIGGSWERENVNRETGETADIHAMWKER